MDKHMDNRHMDKIPPAADVCLADFCEVLQCDEHQVGLSLTHSRGCHTGYIMDHTRFH